MPKMSNLIENVREFTKIAGCTVDKFNPKQAALYMSLIEEERKEVLTVIDDTMGVTWGLSGAFKKGFFDDGILNANRSELTHELADLAWVTIGALLSLGVDVEGVFNELARANMDKSSQCPGCGGHGEINGKYINLPYSDERELVICQTCNGTGKIMLKNEYGKVVKPHGWRKADMTPFIKDAL